MTISNLYLRSSYKAGSDMPVCVLLQGWNGSASDWAESTLDRIANYGFAVVAPGLRGRNGADGSADAAGLEPWDVYDALLWARANIPGASQDKAVVVGESGGGGVALGCACKFPDTFQAVVDLYGMSDMGRNNPDGWYYNNSGFTASIVTRVGGTPAAVPNLYYARDATAAITNYTGGKLIILHDDQDSTVPVVHSTRIKTALDGAGLTNYSYNISTTTDDTRWTHGLSWSSGTMYKAELIWVPLALAESVWTIPTSGTITVIGYIVTKRFTIWLDGGASAGRDAAATVVYNTATDTYTVTPLTGSLSVSITQGAKSGSATNISAETEIVVT